MKLSIETISSLNETYVSSSHYTIHPSDKSKGIVVTKRGELWEIAPWVRLITKKEIDWFAINREFSQ